MLLLSVVVVRLICITCYCFAVFVTVYHGALCLLLYKNHRSGLIISKLVLLSPESTCVRRVSTIDSRRKTGSNIPKGT